jgi:rhamnosyltransferase
MPMGLSLESTVTIVIRSKNEADRIGSCLSAIAAQDYPAPVDVIVIDSGSTDETVEIARAFKNVSVRQIAPSGFNYGGVLNQGIALASGAFVVPMSAHCVPVNNQWLKQLVSPFVRDELMAGTYSRQIPWPECDSAERYSLAATFGQTDRVFDGINGLRSEFDVVFSNASCCIRRDLALRQPFLLLPWAEDRVWAFRMLKNGYKIQYAAGSIVYHSHQRGVCGYYRVGLLYGRAFNRLRCANDMLCHTKALFKPSVGLGYLARCYYYAHSRTGSRMSRLLSSMQGLFRLLAQDFGIFVGKNGL